MPAIRRGRRRHPLSAGPRGLGFHHDPEYTKLITNVRWIVLHVIEETAVHSGHLEIARDYSTGKPGSADADLGRAMTYGTSPP
jgi:hypothetical protein